jgi:phosphate/sulfate permease
MGLNAKLFAKIIFWWVITVPVAFGVSALVEEVVKHV